MKCKPAKPALKRQRQELAYIGVTIGRLEVPVIKEFWKIVVCLIIAFILVLQGNAEKVCC